MKSKITKKPKTRIIMNSISKTNTIQAAKIIKLNIKMKI